MVELKLAKLPDRTPVKIAITVPPELNRALLEYAEAYRASYGEAESVAELIPFILAAFVDSDSSFRKARRGRDEAPNGSDRDPPKSRRSGTPALPATSPVDLKDSN